MTELYHEKGGTMHKISYPQSAEFRVLFFIILVLCTGCTSTGFLGLAKESYVKQLEDENIKLKEEIESLKNEMTQVLELADNIEKLEDYAERVKSKLDKLPEETLRKIVDILQNYLDEKERND